MSSHSSCCTSVGVGVVYGNSMLTQIAWIVTALLAKCAHGSMVMRLHCVQLMHGAMDSNIGDKRSMKVTRKQRPGCHNTVSFVSCA